MEQEEAQAYLVQIPNTTPASPSVSLVLDIGQSQLGLRSQGLQGLPCCPTPHIGMKLSQSGDS